MYRRLIRCVLLLWFPLLVAFIACAAAPALPVPVLPPVPTPADHVVWSLIDVQGRPAAERPYLRYLALGHLPNAKAKQEQWQVTSGHANGTSRERVIYRPAVILAPLKPGPLEVADGLSIAPADWDRAVLIRLNIAHYGWKREVYETLALVDPHFHFKEKKFAETVVKVAGKWVSPAAAKVLPASLTTLNAAPEITGEAYWKGRHIAREPTYRGGTWRWRYRYADPNTDGQIRWYSEGSYPCVPEGVTVARAEKARPVYAIPPHGAWLPKAEITQLALETVSDVPILYADFSYWQTGIQNDRAPGPGYNDLIQVKNQKDFFELVGVDPKAFAKQFRDYLIEYRAAVGRSGIAYQPRRIVVFDKPGGELWATFDNRLALRERNPLETPDDTFVFDASEQYAHLSNGMWAFFLGDANGVAQASAPDFIGHDSTSTSRLARIELGKSCISCHTQGGLQDFNDWYRNQFRPPVRLDSPEYRKIKDVQRLYFVNISGKLKQGRERYAAALREATGLTPAEYARVVKSRWYAYADAPTAVDISRAARELGTTKGYLQASLRGFKSESLRGYTVLDMFLRPEAEQEPLVLEQWNESVTEAHKALVGARP